MSRSFKHSKAETTERKSKQSQSAAATLRGTIRARIKTTQLKSRTKKPKEETQPIIIEEQESKENQLLDDFIIESTARNNIRVQILQFLENYVTETKTIVINEQTLTILAHPPSISEGFDITANTRVSIEFPLIYNSLIYERPFTDDELSAIANDQRLLDATIDNTPLDIAEQLRTYSNILYKYPYAPIRSQALEQLDLFSRFRDRPIIIINKLHNDELFSVQEIENFILDYQIPQEIISLLQKYNTLLKTQFNIHDITEANVVISPNIEIIYKKELAAATSRLVTIKKLVKSLEKQNKTIPELKKHISEYRASFQQQLAEEYNMNILQIDEDATSSFINEQNNLPIWVFMLTWISKPHDIDETKELLSNDDLAQFSRFFRRLSFSNQYNFIGRIITKWPPSDYPYGPPISLLSEVISEYNNRAIWKIGEIAQDATLASCSNDEFYNRLISMPLLELLHYRRIIFPRIANDIDESNRDQLINLYNSSLIKPSYPLVYAFREIKRKRTIPGRKGKPSKTIEENDYIPNIYIQATVSLIIPNDIDFIIPWSNETKTILNSYLDQLFSTFTQSMLSRFINLPKSPDDINIHNIDQIKLQTSNESVVNIISYLATKIQYYYCAMLPTDEDFYNWLKDKTVAILQKLLSLPPIESINDLTITIPPDALKLAAKKLQLTKQSINQSFTSTQLNIAAWRIGLNLGWNKEHPEHSDLRPAIPLARSELHNRLLNQVREGDISQEEMDKTLDEVDDFIAIYNEFYYYTAPHSTELLKKEKEIRTFVKERTKELLDEARDNKSLIIQDVWEKINEQKITQPLLLTALKNYITQKYNTLQEASNEQGTLLSSEQLTINAWDAAARHAKALKIPSQQIKQIQELVTSLTTQLIDEAISSGILITSEQVEGQVKREAEESGIATPEQLATIMIKKAKTKSARRRALKLSAAEIKRKVKSMPQILRDSISATITNISQNLENINMNQRNEIANMYKLVSNIIILTSRSPPQEIINNFPQLAEAYSTIVPESFIQGLFDIIRSENKIMAQQLFNYVRVYSGGIANIINNPLIPRRTRRRRRIERNFRKLSAVGDLQAIQQNIPILTSSYMKECIMVHRLKPWLNIPNIQNWMLLIANAKGLKRENLSLKDRQLFNPTLAEQIILKLPSGQYLYFYHPTNKFWIEHCKQFHNNISECDSNGLVRAFTKNKDAEIYELLINTRPVNKYSRQYPIFPANVLIQDKEIIIPYHGDTDNLKFLAQDPQVYSAECEWFKNRYRNVEFLLNQTKEFIIKPMPKRTIITYEQQFILSEIQKLLREEIREILSLLFIQYGNPPNQTTNSIVQDNTEALLMAIYQYIKNNNEQLNIYSLLTTAYEFLILINPVDPVGKKAIFIQGLVGQCASDFYPQLFVLFPTRMQWFPEIYYLPESKGASLLREKVNQYIDQKRILLMDRLLLRVLNNSLVSTSSIEPLEDNIQQKIKQTNFLSASNEIDKKLYYQLQSTLQNSLDINNDTGLSVGLLFNQDIINALVKLPDINLKNICINGDEFKELDPAQLIYYADKGKVYCISKFQLSSMAQSKQYQFNNINFNPEFVNGFINYTQWSAMESDKQLNYINQLLESLISDPKDRLLLDHLVKVIVMFGKIEEEDMRPILTKFGIIIEQQNPNTIRYTLNKINNLVQNYISDKIISAAEAYIKTNQSRLVGSINELYLQYRSQEPLVESDIRLASNGSFISRDDFDKLIFEPVASEIILHIKESLDLEDDDNAKSIIIQSLRKLIAPLPQKLEQVNKRVCKMCNIKLPAIKTIIEDHGNISIERIPSEMNTVIRQTNNKLGVLHEIVEFCSSSCAESFHANEPEVKDINLIKLQNAINKVTESYIDYTQMLLWARFPQTWDIPQNPEEQIKLIRNYSIIHGLPEDDVKVIIPQLVTTESSLGIYTINDNGQQLSEAELWDRIRTHPNFVPSVAELIKEDKLDSLMYLANYFNIPVYEGIDEEDVISYYSATPEELRNIWKELRAKDEFINILFSTVHTFDPAKNKATNMASTSVPQRNTIDILNKFNESLANRPIIPDIDQWTEISMYVNKYLRNIDMKSIISTIIELTNIEKRRTEQEELTREIQPPVPLIGENIDILNMLEEIRKQLIIDIGNSFPNLTLKISKVDIMLMRSFRRTLEYWFNNHISALKNKSLVTLEWPENKMLRILSSAELFRIFTIACDNANVYRNKPYNDLAKAVSTWTAFIINNYRDKNGEHNIDKMKFNTDYYPQILQEYKCARIPSIERNLAQFSYTMSKINSIIDTELSIILEESQNPPIPIASNIPRKGRKIGRTFQQAQIEKVIGPSLEQLIDQSRTSALMPLMPTNVTNIPSYYTRAELLIQLRKIRNQYEWEQKKRKMLKRKSQRVTEHEEVPNIPPTQSAAAIERKEINDDNDLRERLANVLRVTEELAELNPNRPDITTELVQKRVLPTGDDDIASLVKQEEEEEKHNIEKEKREVEERETLEIEEEFGMNEETAEDYNEEQYNKEAYENEEEEHEHEKEEEEYEGRNEFDENEAEIW